MRRLLRGWRIMCTAFLCCCCRRKLLGCLAPQSSAGSSFLAAHLLWSPRNGSSATAAGTGARGARAGSGGGGLAARPGQPCCEASPGSTWSGWATRPACCSSAGRSWPAAHRGAPAGKSRERPRPRLRPPRPGVTAARRACALRPAARRSPGLPARPSSLGRPPSHLSVAAEPRQPPGRYCGRGYTMERLDKAALNALQPPDFRSESSLASTLKTLLFFTALMITVPIGLYFTTKSYIFEGAFGMSNRDSYFYAAIVAVVAVHVVLALFVYVAWNEGSRQWREGKQD
uniref:Vacuolar ATPase assembly integral membrane protein VMA21 n=1 Tax=Equus caballus TaxID=9796 RepID=A0A3Q2IB77_HORSE